MVVIIINEYYNSFEAMLKLVPFENLYFKTVQEVKYRVVNSRYSNAVHPYSH